MISIPFLLLALLTLPSGALPTNTCTDEYYMIDLVPTRRVPAAHQAEGVAKLSFAPSPFGIALDSEGNYLYDVVLQVNRLELVEGHEFTAWLSTPDLKSITRLGRLSHDGQVAGQVSWSKFLVIITLEPAGSTSERWTGPVVMRGLSRSGLMHTMAGHGPFEQEPCTVYGYY
ncbi:MAG: hypothetical protein F4069_03600 [Rhodothermaceae bacterium]|nr:hypothetical protein [Rhodothermaceae bacterium]MYG69478.1 hypothetical protein [Rhodothermaceae bacterium]MYJ44403.1 hypothetical protein [Rhodothermaceae bacterium]